MEALLPTPVASSRVVSLERSSGAPSQRANGWRKGPAEEMKAVMSGELTMNGQRKHCLLLGAYLLYSEIANGSSASFSAGGGGPFVAGRQKSLCLSDAVALFEAASLTIHLTKLKSQGAAGSRKTFVARTEADHHRWQAAITRAVALWPGKNAVGSRSGQPPVSADPSALGGILRGMLRAWAFTSFATGVDGLIADDVSAGIRCLRAAGAPPPPRQHEPCHDDASRDSWEEARCEGFALAEQELYSTTRLSTEGFNSLLVNTVVQLPYLLPKALEAFVLTVLERRNRALDAIEARALVKMIAPKLRGAGNEFVSVALEYGFDMATGLWPLNSGPSAAAAGREGDGSPSSSPPPLATVDCVRLFRMWVCRAPTAPWSAVRAITQQFLARGMQEVLHIAAPPRVDPCMPGLNGIHNLGNTCYLNAALQCVLHTPHLIRLFLSGTHRLFVGFGTSSHSLSAMLGELFSRMYTGSRALDASSIASFLSNYDEEAFKEGEQHDAHEALATILDVLDAELCEGGCASSSSRSQPREKRRSRSRGGSPSTSPLEALPRYTSRTLSEDALIGRWRAAYVQSHNSPVTHYFSGQTVQRVTCAHCHAASLCCDSFTYLIAPVVLPNGGDDRGSPCVRLERCLEEVFRTETILVGEKAVCATCQHSMTEARRSLSLQRLPPYLIICLSRFEVDEHGKVSSKLAAPVLAPEQLSLGPWLRSAATLPIVSEGGNVCFREMDHAVEQRGSYELYAAVLHSGSIHRGHYKSVCRVGGSWYEYNDICVRHLTSYSSWAEERAKELYVVFYRSTAGGS